MEKSTGRIFGPVASRRLGRSLGVDLVPFKTCTYDCIYCECGATTIKTTERREYAPMEETLGELSRRLRQLGEDKPDYITLSGSGEPTLHSRLGEIIARIKEMTDVPVAVLTNGSLLSDAQVRGELRDADVVLPSLDAADAKSFNEIDRPAAEIDFDTMIDGMVRFRDEFFGEIWLEVFIVEGITSTQEQARRLADIAARIGADKVQLNTAVRPTTEKGVSAVSRERLQELARLFPGDTEVVASFTRTKQRVGTASEGDVLATVERRPSTVEDIAAALNVHRTEAFKIVESLVEERKIAREERDGDVFYISGRLHG